MELQTKSGDVEMKIAKLVGIMFLVVIAIAIVRADDAELNYIRGTVFMPDGTTPAPGGTIITVRITSGVNNDYGYTFYVDDDGVPPPLYGRGFYNSKDNINFDTNATFVLTATTSLLSASKSGNFVMGGNGAWNSDEINLVLQPTMLSWVLVAILISVIIIIVIYKKVRKRGR